MARKSLSGYGIGDGYVGWARVEEQRPGQRPLSSSGKMFGGLRQGGGHREVRQVLSRRWR